MKEQKNELVFYLIIIIICNNLFWNFGKHESNEYIEEIENNTTYLETNNIIYNVPYEEEWLD